MLTDKKRWEVQQEKQAAPTVRSKWCWRPTSPTIILVGISGGLMLELLSPCRSALCFFPTALQDCGPRRGRAPNNVGSDVGCELPSKLPYPEGPCRLAIWNYSPKTIYGMGPIITHWQSKWTLCLMHSSCHHGTNTSSAVALLI